MNLMRYSHSKGTRLFQTILWNIEQNTLHREKIKDERLYNLINCYLCTISRSATVFFVLRKKRLAGFCAREKSKIPNTQRSR